MLKTENAVTFLEESGSLHLGESPWRTLEQDEEKHRIDWNRLRGDQWDFPITEEERGQLDDALGRGPPTSGGAESESAASTQWDICAWYQPIHFFGSNWGIFIKESCVRRTALMIARFAGGGGAIGLPRPLLWRQLIRAAILVYYLHEHYHHKIECLGFRLHVVTRRSSYLPYQYGVYRPTYGSDANLEEALANADCYLRFGQNQYRSWLLPLISQAVRAYLQWEFPRDPPGYRRAVDYLVKADFDAGENFLQAQVKEATLAPAQPIREWDLCPQMTHSFFGVNSNIWTVVPTGALPRLPLI